MRYARLSISAKASASAFVARAAVVVHGGSRTLSQRFLDFETFDTEAETTARAQAGQGPGSMNRFCMSRWLFRLT
jgi:hypothetical protein